MQKYRRAADRAMLELQIFRQHEQFSAQNNIHNLHKWPIHRYSTDFLFCTAHSQVSVLDLSRIFSDPKRFIPFFKMLLTLYVSNVET